LFTGSDTRASASSWNSASHRAARRTSCGDDGADTTVALDADGGAGGAGFTPIATLSGVTGADLDTLITEGNLEAA
jgi:hypothetical protein